MTQSEEKEDGVGGRGSEREEEKWASADIKQTPQFLLQPEYAWAAKWEREAQESLPTVPFQVLCGLPPQNLWKRILNIPPGEDRSAVELEGGLGWGRSSPALAGPHFGEGRPSWGVVAAQFRRRTIYQVSALLGSE